MNDADVELRVEQITPLLSAVCGRLRDEVQLLGFADGDVSIGEYGEALFRLERDPASGEHSLIGEWRDDRGTKLGVMAFHADGSFFAEHDVIRTHPSRPSWFVEAVTAWGRGQDIKSEPRLLPMVS